MEVFPSIAYTAARNSSSLKTASVAGRFAPAINLADERSGFFDGSVSGSRICRSIERIGWIDAMAGQLKELIAEACRITTV